MIATVDEMLPETAATAVTVDATGLLHAVVTVPHPLVVEITRHARMTAMTDDETVRVMTAVVREALWTVNASVTEIPEMIVIVVRKNAMFPQMVMIVKVNISCMYFKTCVADVSNS